VVWTIPIPDHAVSVQPGAGKARYAMTDLAMPDYFNIPNAFFRFLDPVSQRSVVSFDIHMSGPITERKQVRVPADTFEGSFVLNQATMTWSARTADGWSFRSHPDTTSAFSMLGHERNGVFFG